MSPTPALALNPGGNTRTAIRRSAGTIAVGPLLQNPRRPVDDLSPGALLQHIVNTAATTAIQAQAPSEKATVQ